MYLFTRPEYKSEFTRFLDELKQTLPHIVDEQRAGLARLWDKPPLDLEQTERAKAARVARSAYVYE